MPDDETYTVSTVRRRKRRNLSQPIRHPQDVYRLVKPLVGEEVREHFYCLYLDNRNRLLALDLVSVGSISAAIVHPREVYRRGVQLAATSVVVAHNHPSGETDPSEDDLAITQRLQHAGEILGIPLLDHVILSNGSFTSLKEGGIL